ncbi:MAG TPA: hypothetical protein PKI62_05435 [bacterium]|nr:hypothetical protein [bacterium]HPR87403.1 hypothetical protein [bacterium]
MKRVAAGVLLLLCALPLHAQKSGAVEVGGSFTFHSNTDADERNYSELGLDGLVCYYLGKTMAIDIEPGIRLGLAPDSTDISTLFLGSLRMKLWDLSPSGYRKNDIYRMDLGISSSIYANIGAGVWTEGFSLTQKPGETYAGPALMAGVGSFSRFGRFSTLRIKFQFIELFPSTQVYTKRRTIVQVGAGFGLFIRN